MANAGAEFEQLHDWVVNLTALQIICIKKAFGADVPKMTLNSFALAKVISTVGSSNLYNFGVSVHKQFPEYDPEDPEDNPGDQTTFADLTDLIGPLTLQESVVAYVKAAVTAQGQKPSMKATLAQQFQPSGWAGFTSSIHTSNLDSVLGDPATVISGLAALYTNGTETKLPDLINFLTTIQPVPGGGQ